MDLIGQEEKRGSIQGKKKIVTFSLIVSVMVLIVLIIVIILLVGQPVSKPFGIFIDDEPLGITEGLIITDEEGNTYISIEAIAKGIGWDRYLKGIYGRDGQDKNYGYLENNNEIVGFEAGSNIIYKTTPHSVVEFQYYEMNSKIINSEDNLYILIDDLQLACNVRVEKVDKEIKIYTSEFLIEYYGKLIAEQDHRNNIVRDYMNRKALSYDMIVATKSERFCVLELDLKERIGPRYRDLQFIEFDKTFIATSPIDGKMGVIDSKGEPIVPLEYDNVRIISYEPLLYEVKVSHRHGIIDAKGNEIVRPEYDAFGYNVHTSVIDRRESVLIIPKVLGDDSGIVMRRNGLHGVINLKTGAVIFRM